MLCCHSSDRLSRSMDLRHLALAAELISAIPYIQIMTEQHVSIPYCVRVQLVCD